MLEASKLNFNNLDRWLLQPTRSCSPRHRAITVVPEPFEAIELDASELFGDEADE